MAHRDLIGNDWRARRAAVEELASQGISAVQERLLALVRDGHEDASTLAAAVQLLIRAGAEAAAPLRQLLFHETAAVRTYTAQMLGLAGDRESIPELMSLVDDPDANVRYHAVEALGRLQALEAVDRLLALVEEGGFYLAMPAIEALGLIGDRGAVPVLMMAMDDPLVAGAAAEALGRLGDPRAAGRIARWLGSQYGEVDPAVTALARLAAAQEEAPPEHEPVADVTARHLDDGGRRRLNQAARSSAMEEMSPPPYTPALALVLGWLAERGDARPLVDALVGLMRMPNARAVAAEALVRAGPVAVPGLAAMLREDDRDLRLEAARALSRLPGPEAASALQGALGDESEEIAAMAARGLGSTEGWAGVDPLMACFRSPSALVRREATEAVRRLAPPDLASRLPALLDDPDPGVRECAVSLLPGSGARDALLRGMADAEEQVRRMAAERLAQSANDDPEVAEALVGLLRSADARERAHMVRALNDAVTPFALPLLEESARDPEPWVRLQACRALLRHAPPVRLLAELSRDAVPYVRAAAAEVLGATPGDASAEALVPLLTDREADVRLAAVAAARNRPETVLKDGLLAALEQSPPEMRSQVLASLAGYAGEEVLGALRRAVEQPVTRLAALEALQASADHGADAVLADLVADERHRGEATPHAVRRGASLARELRRRLRARGEPYEARAAYVQVLYRLPLHLAADALTAALDDDDARIRTNARQALARISDDPQRGA